eukprot:1024638-Prymnesium_polylepis.1
MLRVDPLLERPQRAPRLQRGQQRGACARIARRGRAANACVEVEEGVDVGVARRARGPSGGRGGRLLARADRAVGVERVEVDGARWLQARQASGVACRRRVQRRLQVVVAQLHGVEQRDRAPRRQVGYVQRRRARRLILGALKRQVEDLGRGLDHVFGRRAAHRDEVELVSRLEARALGRSARKLAAQALHRARHVVEVAAGERVGQLAAGVVDGRVVARKFGVVGGVEDDAPARGDHAPHRGAVEPPQRARTVEDQRAEQRFDLRPESLLHRRSDIRVLVVALGAFAAVAREPDRDHLSRVRDQPVANLCQ